MKDKEHDDTKGGVAKSSKFNKKEIKSDEGAKPEGALKSAAEDEAVDHSGGYGKHGMKSHMGHAVAHLRKEKESTTSNC